MKNLSRESREDLCILGVLRVLGNIATTSKITQKANEFGYKINVRKALRRLKKQGILKTDRPNSDLEIRWEFVDKENRK